MKIKLTNGQENWLFEDDGVKYCLRPEPTLPKLTIKERAEAAERGVGGTFLFGRVELWKISKGGQIEEQRNLSKDFHDEHYNGEPYATALRDGFEVQPGFEESAQLLIKHGLASEPRARPRRVIFRTVNGRRVPVKRN